MKKYISIIAFSVLMSFSAGAAELLVTSAADAKGAKPSRASLNATDSVALDFVSDGDVVGFQFNIPLPKGVGEKQVNIKSCVSEVPSIYFSNCSVAKGHVIVQVANDAGDAVPAGVFPVGRLSLSGFSAKDLGAIQVIAADKNAEAISSSVRIVK